MVRLSSGEWALIDMDASAPIDTGLAGRKVTSCGYWPPELAKAYLSSNGEGIGNDMKASKAIDVSPPYLSLPAFPS